MNFKKKSIKGLYEGAAINKQVKLSGGPPVLKALGINNQEINSVGDLHQVLNHLHSVLMFALSNLSAQANKFPEANEKVKPALEKVKDTITNLRAAASSLAPEVAPKPQSDPRTGYTDDPNPETRGLKYPNKGYRSS